MKIVLSLLIALTALPLLAQNTSGSSVPRFLGSSVGPSNDSRSSTEEPSDRESAEPWLLAQGTNGLSVARFLGPSAGRSTDSGNSTEEPSDPETEKPWVYWAGLDAFITPDETYAAPTVMADRSWLHLEARYNYEGKETASVWAGYNINHANRDKWVVTPMIAAVFGDTKGIAPGVEVIANWKKFDVYLEGEYLFASGEDSEDFAYFWSELAWSPLSWLRTGIAAQRTRTFDTGVDIQRGLLVGLKYRKLTFTTSMFEPGSDNQTIVVTLATEF